MLPPGLHRMGQETSLFLGSPFEQSTSGDYGKKQCPGQPSKG